VLNHGVFEVCAFFSLVWSKFVHPCHTLGLCDEMAHNVVRTKLNLKSTKLNRKHTGLCDERAHKAIGSMCSRERERERERLSTTMLTEPGDPGCRSA
jgi:hypothetical protein